MTSVLNLEAKLERADSNIPWGFRLQGGKDFSTPLTIQNVIAGSLAAKCGLQVGDIITKIGEERTDEFKHKDAQHFIIQSGNRLDLLLKRGAAPVQRQYETFSTPTYAQKPPPPPQQTTPTYSSTPVYGTQSSTSAYKNQTPRPFGQSPNVNSITQQTQNMSFSPKPVAADLSTAAKKYTEMDDKPPTTAYQSKSFKVLEDIMSGSQEPPPIGSALKPLPTTNTSSNRRTPSPQPGFNSTRSQFNTPIGLYSSDNVNNAYRMQRNEDTPDSGSSGTDSDVDQLGKKVYRPSETFRLVQEADNKATKEEETSKPVQSRTLKMLQQQLGTGEAQAQQQFQQQQAPPPPRAPPAPKPGMWAPPKAPAAAPAPAAPAAKPFTPSVQPPPPAPAAPKGPPPRPSGVGAVRGKKGDVTVFKAGDMAPGGARIPICNRCGANIRGPFVVALHKTWCPDHFTCDNPQCNVKLVDIGFIEEGGFLYCEKDYEQYFAPHCAVCSNAIVGDCVNALNKTYHPTCFTCHQCHRPIGGNQFHMEDGKAYCEADWKQMFQTMCKSCEFPIEPGDRWVEAMESNYHSECFNCSTCQVNLEGQPFYAKAGKPYCKKHAR